MNTRRRTSEKRQVIEFDETGQEINSESSTQEINSESLTQINDVQNIEPNQQPNDLVDYEVMQEISSVQADNITQTSNKISITKQDIKNVVDKLSSYKDISTTATYIGMGELFRKGGANAGASNILSVPVNCPVHGTPNCYISKYDILNSMQIVLGHKAIRKLAEAMAPTILTAYLQKIQRNPTLDLRGDLANRINRKLLNKNQTPLTQEEQICCCTYTQWMANLNTLAQSDRLKALLEDDLISRKRNNNKIQRNKETDRKRPNKRQTNRQNRTQTNRQNRAQTNRQSNIQMDRQ